MLEKKRKLDFYFLLLVLIVGILGFFYSSALYMSLGLLLGFIATSITMEKDMRRAANEMSKIWLNLGINILLYAIALVGANMINTTTFIFAAIGLLGYRNILLLRIRK